jgi:outer membrane protein assembly factor BamB
LWKRNLQQDHGEYTIWWGHANSPLLYGDLVISVCMQDSLIDLGRPAAASYVVAHHRRTGRLAWLTKRMTAATAESCDAYTTPLIHKGEGVTRLVLWGGQVLDAYDPSTGNRVWELSGLGGNRVIPNAVIAGDVAFITEGMRGPLHAVSIKDPDNLNRTDIVWTYTRGTSDSPTPVVCGQLLFFITNDGFATCLDTSDGSRIWKERLPGQYRASPLAADGRIYFLNTEGLMTVIAANREYQCVAQNQLNDQTFASPVVSEGRIFIRGRAGLYCIASD